MFVLGNGKIRRYGAGVPLGTGPDNQICDFRLVTNDDAATVEAANYFNPMATRRGFKVGSLILASLDLDNATATARTARIYVVRSNDGATVTVAPVQATGIV